MKSSLFDLSPVKIVEGFPFIPSLVLLPSALLLPSWSDPSPSPLAGPSPPSSSSGLLVPPLPPLNLPLPPPWVDIVYQAIALYRWTFVVVVMVVTPIMVGNDVYPKEGWNIAYSWNMCAAPDMASIAICDISSDFGGEVSSIFFKALERVMAEALRNNSGSGRGFLTPLSKIFTIYFSYANWILSFRFIFHSPSISVPMYTGLLIRLSFIGLSLTWIPSGESFLLLLSPLLELLGKCRSMDQALSFSFSDVDAPFSRSNFWYILSFRQYQPKLRHTWILGRI